MQVASKLGIKAEDTGEKSNDNDKSDFQTEQIDSPSTSKNLDNYDRESEEWEGISNKIFQSKKNHSPDTMNSIKLMKIEGKLNFHLRIRTQKQEEGQNHQFCLQKQSQTCIKES